MTIDTSIFTIIISLLSGFFGTLIVFIFNHVIMKPINKLDNNIKELRQELKQDIRELQQELKRDRQEHREDLKFFYTNLHNKYENLNNKLDKK